MKKTILLTATTLGAISVIIGAMGSHLFENYLISVDRLETFETSVRYQFYHIFLLLAIGIIYNTYNQQLLIYAFYFCLTGFLLFCGSLYLLCLTDNSMFGIITPLGGISFILSWLFVFFSIKRTKK